MNEHRPSTLTDSALLAVRERHIDRLRRVFAGDTSDGYAFALCGVERRLDGARMQDVPAAVAAALDGLASKAEALRDDVVFRPLTVECDIHGVHFMDKIFGADVFTLDGSWQAHLLAQPVGQLRPPDLDRNPTWQRAREMARAFVATGATVPYFGLPTIASALNVGVNLFGQELLVAMLVEPEAAHRDLRVINRTLCAMHQWYRATLPPAQLQPVVGSYRTQPPGFGQLCGCTTHLLSQEQYREFIAPLDAELLGTYPHGGMIHLCGAHVQHIPVWREMKELRAVQVNDRAADDLWQYLSGLREDQILYVNPTAHMSVERIMRITNGRRVVIVSDVKDRNQILTPGTSNRRPRGPG